MFVRRVPLYNEKTKVNFFPEENKVNNIQINDLNRFSLKDLNTFSIKYLDNVKKMSIITEDKEIITYYDLILFVFSNIKSTSWCSDKSDRVDNNLAHKVGKNIENDLKELIGFSFLFFKMLPNLEKEIVHNDIKRNIIFNTKLLLEVEKLEKNIKNYNKLINSLEKDWV